MSIVPLNTLDRLRLWLIRKLAGQDAIGINLILQRNGHALYVPGGVTGLFYNLTIGPGHMTGKLVGPSSVKSVT